MSEIQTIIWKGDHVVMIDQRRLPNEEVFVKCSTYEDVAEAIRSMVIRGAPAIGVAAAMGVALGIQKADSVENMPQILATLIETRPTAVNLKWAIDRMRSVFESVKTAPLEEIKERLIKEAQSVYDEDLAINRAMADNGKSFIKSGDNVLTYCNTGTLATAGYGTALGVIRAAFESGCRFSVTACETRPFLQGLRLTSWELKKLGIPQTVISDNMAASLMAKRKISSVFVGADRVAANGDAANKIGTYMLAVLAKYHGVPFYVVAPTSTIDKNCPTGKEIPIEERDPKEITHIGGQAIGLSDVPVYNPAFDVTPANLITALITENEVSHY